MAVAVSGAVETLDVQRRTGELGHHWVTTIEQTVLDLAARPGLGDLPGEARSAVRALLPRADSHVLEDLATAQRRGAPLRRARTAA
ncbi:hypothetical protein [Qaidamihabitans albus]|uniref:hypothetical protein n=1 Tax=Qaidamihabitans albus TaxID=2795733 RepID=UPI0018F1DB05|nr:hypothetical protein [Qaidamihabitans albus]